MKKGKTFKIINQFLTLFTGVVFFVFSTGVLVNIHESCKTFHHLCCEEHHECEDLHSVSLIPTDPHESCKTSILEDPLLTTLDHDHLDSEVEACSNHSHCFLITYLLKISDQYMGVDYASSLVKTVTPIQLFFNDDVVSLRVKIPEIEIHKTGIDPPKRFENSQEYIKFTSQRVLYA
jgi:hypothetical protein